MSAVLFAVLFQAVIPMRSLDKGLMSLVEAPRQATARTAAEWSALWTQHAGDAKRPSVDFTKEMVVAVFLGSRPSAGFSVEIAGAREEGAVLVVKYRETRPEPGTTAAQILTAPYHFVAVPKHTEVRFEKSQN